MSYLTLIKTDVVRRATTSGRNGESLLRIKPPETCGRGRDSEVWGLYENRTTHTKKERITSRKRAKNHKRIC